MTPRKRTSDSTMLWLFVGMGIALILAGVFMLPLLRQQKQQEQAEQGEFQLPGEKDYYALADGNALGDPNAPITIMEFSDVQCPHCQRWAREVESAFIEQFVKTGKVRFVYRSMGDFLGPESLLAAEGMYCAEEQGAFWPFHDTVFLNLPPRPNSGWYSEERLTAMARALGLDAEAFATCMKERRYRERALQDKEEGLRFGVRGTPAFVFQTQDGQLFLLEGAHPISSFQSAVQQLLQGSP